jgi:hypothetical protein
VHLADVPVLQNFSFISRCYLVLFFPRHHDNGFTDILHNPLPKLFQGNMLISEYPFVSGFPQIPKKKSWEEGPSSIHNLIPRIVDWLAPQALRKMRESTC